MKNDGPQPPVAHTASECSPIDALPLRVFWGRTGLIVARLATTNIGHIRHIGFTEHATASVHFEVTGHLFLPVVGPYL